jgi:pectate lyase
MRKPFFIFLFLLLSVSFFQTAFAGTGGGKRVQLTLTPNFTQIQQGQSFRLAWLASNGENIICIAGGGWLGNKTPVNIETITPNVGLTYTLSCRGSDSSATTTQSVFIDVIKTNPSPVRAFPEAEGFGAYTPGGRGGRIIEVTTLDDSGPGSFRDAVSTSGPRIVVFRVGGTIDVCKNNQQLLINNPHITIAGQTAPGDGITLKLSSSCIYSALYINTHDVVIRHLRIRPGRGQGSTGDAISVLGNSYNVILDHLSLSWAPDENINLSRGARDFTLQWSILSEPLAIGPSDYAYNALIADDEGFTGTGNISLHHNLFTHGLYRNPQINIAGVIDVVNNIIYNYKTMGMRVWNIYDKPARANIVGNYFIPTSSTTGPTREIITQNTPGRGYSPLSVYVRDNIGPKRPTNDLPQTNSVTCEHRAEAPITHIPCEDATFVSSTPFNTPPITTTSAQNSYAPILANAGANPTRRDDVDNRVALDVINKTGIVISNTNEVGGWPILESGTPLSDTDHDGMPDTWELTNGLDATNALDGNNDADGDIYTNVEEFLNGTNPRVAQAAEFPTVAYRSLEQTAQVTSTDAHSRVGLVLLGSIFVLLFGILTYQHFKKPW